MDDVIWLNDIPVEPSSPDDVPADWTVGRFQKLHGCQQPGQCDADCDCGCPYKGMS